VQEYLVSILILFMIAEAKAVKAQIQVMMVGIYRYSNTGRPWD
jgi:hypothetical protein